MKKQRPLDLNFEKWLIHLTKIYAVTFPFGVIWYAEPTNRLSTHSALNLLSLYKTIGVIGPVALPQAEIVAFSSCPLTTKFILFDPFSKLTVKCLYKLRRLSFLSVLIIRSWDIMRILSIKFFCSLLKKIINNIFIEIRCFSRIHWWIFSPLKLGFLAKNAFKYYRPTMLF